MMGAASEAAEAAELNDGTTFTVSLEPGLDEIFDEGTRRLHEKSTWKLWQWPPEEKEFFDADSFRYFVSIPGPLQHFSSHNGFLDQCERIAGPCHTYSGLQNSFSMCLTAAACV